MKAVFLSYNQALTDRVNAILDKQGIRGFTKWALTEGRGSVDGEPHYGTHAWPSMNASILAIVDDEKVAPLMDAFREMDAATRMQGSRAFVWNIESGFRFRCLRRACRTSLRRGGGGGEGAGRTERTRVRSVRPVFHDARHLPRTDRNPGFVGSAIFGDRMPYLKRMRQCGAKNEAMHHKVPRIALIFLHLHP